MAVTAALVGGAVAAPIIGGLMGQQAAKANREAAEAAMQRAFEQINAVDAPPDLSREIILKEFKSAGLYTPELEQQITAGTPEASKVKTDPKLLQAQMNALDLIQQRASGGLNPEDRAQLNQIRQQISTENQGRMESIKQNMQARGQAGGGSELAQQLLAAQGSANQESQMGDRLAAQASQNALSAAMQTGQLGGQIEGQQFGEGQQNAQAADRFKLFDVQNSLAQQQRNVASQNQAQQSNLTNNQNLLNTNTAQTNAERYRQAQAQQQYWQSQLNLATAKSNALTGQANQQMQLGQQQADMYAGIGAGVGSGLGAGANAYASNPSAFGGGKVKVNDYGAPAPMSPETKAGLQDPYRT